MANRTRWNDDSETNGVAVLEADESTEEFPQPFEPRTVEILDFLNELFDELGSDVRTDSPTRTLGPHPSERRPEV